MSTYLRRSPPVAVQWALGVFVYGIFGPLVWTLEKAGWAARVLGAFSARHDLRVSKKNPLQRYVPGKQDVFVMTYAKSGTNWMLQIVHQLIYHGRGEFDHIHDVVPWPDSQIMGPLMRRYAIPLQDASHWTTSPQLKRVIKTHFNWELLPYSEDARYIAVIRDPKDIFVSNYFFIQNSVYGPAMPSVDTWFNLFLSENFPVGGSWAGNAAGYWAQRGRPNVLIVSFKSMKRDLRATVLEVAEFLRIRVADGVIDEVCRRSSFEYMKRIDHKFGMGKLIAWRPPGAMIRSGVQGGSSELLSLDRQREADAYFKSELRRRGSDFPYEEFCDVAPAPPAPGAV